MVSHDPVYGTFDLISEQDAIAQFEQEEDMKEYYAALECRD